MEPQKQTKETLIAKVYSTTRYRGKQVIVMHGKIFPTLNPAASLKKLKLLLHQYPNETPTVIYVPTAETLILCL